MQIKLHQMAIMWIIMVSGTINLAERCKTGSFICKIQKVPPNGIEQISTEMSQCHAGWEV